MRIFISLILACLTSSVFADDFKLTSPKLTDKATIPNLYTCEEGNISPPLTWANAPNNTKTFALIFSCIDSPIGLFYNWILYNIPKTVTRLPEGEKKLPPGLVVGKNTLGESNYRGPCPPDHLLHHYVITIYALNAELNIPTEAEAADVIEEIKGHTIKKAELTATFKH